MAKSSEARADVIGPSFPSFRPLLGRSVSSAFVAEACRDAVLSFLRGANGGWGKADLAAWLAGPYQAVAGLVDHFVAPVRDSIPPSTMPSPQHITDDRITNLLEPAARCALSCLEALARGEPDHYMKDALDRGSLIETTVSFPN